VSHTFAHKQFKKRYPKLSRYVKVGEDLQLENLPKGVRNSEDYKGVSYDELEGRLTSLMSKGKVKK
jgi:hypothetical protein